MGLYIDGDTEGYLILHNGYIKKSDNKIYIEIRLDSLKYYKTRKIDITESKSCNLILKIKFKDGSVSRYVIDRVKKDQDWEAGFRIDKDSSGGIKVKKLRG